VGTGRIDSRGLGRRWPSEPRRERQHGYKREEAGPVSSELWLYRSKADPSAVPDRVAFSRFKRRAERRDRFALASDDFKAGIR
jgi:hypothetical protein